MRAPKPFVAPILARVAGAALSQPVRAADVTLPVLVPITGPFAIEGGAQRNGALLAPAGHRRGSMSRPRFRTPRSPPTSAVNQFERVFARDKPTAVVASMIGIQLLAMLPIGQETKVPMLTTSGTARVTELNNPWIFRFFPADPWRRRSTCGTWWRS